VIRPRSVSTWRRNEYLDPERARSAVERIRRQLDRMSSTGIDFCRYAQRRHSGQTQLALDCYFLRCLPVRSPGHFSGGAMSTRAVGRPFPLPEEIKDLTWGPAVAALPQIAQQSPWISACCLDVGGVALYLASERHADRSGDPHVDLHPSRRCDYVPSGLCRRAHGFSTARRHATRVARYRCRQWWNLPDVGCAGVHSALALAHLDVAGRSQCPHAHIDK
jgi:hypothetical protein